MKIRTCIITEPSRSQPRAPRKGQESVSGFTLIELLVVVLILSMTMGLTIAFVGKHGFGDNLTVASHQVIAGSRQARMTAVSGNMEVLLEIDTGKRTLSIDNFEKAVSLPSNVEINVISAASEQTATSRAGIRFFPDGGSTGGRISLSAEERNISVTIDWLTGRITVEDSNEEKMGGTSQ